MAFVQTKLEEAPSKGGFKWRLLAILVGILLVLGLVLARLPASWFAYGLTQAMPGLYLSGITGTLWRGEASAGTMVIDGQGLALGKVQWQLSPASLLTLSPCAALQANASNFSFASNVCGGLSGSATLNDTELSMPASLLGFWLPVKLRGELSLLLESATLKQQQLGALAGSLSWRDGAYFNGNQWLPLGSYGARLTDDGNAGVDAAVTDLGGPFTANLQLNVNPKLRPNSFTALAIKGELTPRDTVHPELLRFLSLLPQMGAAQVVDNTYQIDWVDG